MTTVRFVELLEKLWYFLPHAFFPGGWGTAARNCQERVSSFSTPTGIAERGVLGPSKSRLSSGPIMPRDHPE